MNSKEDALFTQERIITVSGSVAECRSCVSMIVDKLSEDLEAAQYVNRGLSYTAHLSTGAGAGTNNRGRRSNDHQSVRSCRMTFESAVFICTVVAGQ
jgi:hypothetical protein